MCVGAYHVEMKQERLMLGHKKGRGVGNGHEL